MCACVARNGYRAPIVTLPELCFDLNESREAALLQSDARNLSLQEMVDNFSPIRGDTDSFEEHMAGIERLLRERPRQQRAHMIQAMLALVGAQF